MAGIKTSNGVIKFVTPTTVSSNQPVFTADTISLKRFAASMEVQRWEIETNLMPSNSSADFLLHSVANGFATVFDVEMPQVYRNSSIIPTGSTQATGTAGTYSVTVNSSSNLKSGDFISFSGHQKVYLIMAVSGQTLTVFPKLRSSNLGTLNYGNNTVMKARYDVDTVIGITYTDGILSDPGTIKLIEAL